MLYSNDLRQLFGCCQLTQPLTRYMSVFYGQDIPSLRLSAGPCVGRAEFEFTPFFNSTRLKGENGHVSLSMKTRMDIGDLRIEACLGA